MTQVTTISCDQCGTDLTHTGNSVDYRIVLANERKATKPGLGCVTDMMLYPPIDGGTKHFCGVVCLGAWVSALMPDAAARFEQQQARRPTPTLGSGGPG